MSICGKLYNGQLNDCPDLVKGYIQEIKIANFEDVELIEIEDTCDTANGNYNAKVTLKEGTKAFAFSSVARGSSIRGWVNFDVDDNQMPFFRHHVQIVLTGVTEEGKCILRGLASGLFVAFTRLRKYETPETGIVPAIEVFGLGNGLVAQPFDFNISETGGVAVIELASAEGFEESGPGYIYSAAVAGGEIADWDSDFAGP